jgi:hypothetical protein
MAPAGPLVLFLYIYIYIYIYILKMVNILIHPIDQWSQMAQ